MLLEPCPMPLDDPAASKPQLPVRYISPAQTIAEARRLARMPAGEWRAHYRAVADELGVKHTDLERMIIEIIRATTREQDANQRRRDRKAKSKASLFQKLARLPADRHDAEIRLWAQTYDEDPSVIAREFHEYLGASSEPGSQTAEALWPEPVDGAALVEQIITRIKRYCVVSDEVALVCAHWVLLTCVSGEIAINAPILTLISPTKAAGKSTLASLLSWISRMQNPAKPDYFVSPRVGIYHEMSKGGTIFIEEGQRVYERDSLQEIFDASWMFGVTVPRRSGKNRKEYHVFCQKLFVMLAPDNIPDAAASRHIFCPMLPKLESEVRDDFKNRDDEESTEIRLKAARFIKDHIALIDAANPAMPLGFDNRIGKNWRVMFTIADIVGDAWARDLRNAAVKLLPDPGEFDAWRAC
jgi:hypothetical protein